LGLWLRAGCSVACCFIPKFMGFPSFKPVVPGRYPWRGDRTPLISAAQGEQTLSHIPELRFKTKDPNRGAALPAQTWQNPTLELG
jgi:hypothetical protein